MKKLDRLSKLIEACKVMDAALENSESKTPYIDDAELTVLEVLLNKYNITVKRYSSD